MTAYTLRNAQCAVGTSATNLITGVSGGTTYCKKITVANIHATLGATCTVEKLDNSGSVTRSICKNFPIPINDALIITDEVLEANDIIKITADATSKLEATASALDIV